MSDIELAMSHYGDASRALDGTASLGARHEAGVEAVWALARRCAYEDAARRVREGYMCPGCGHRDEAIHSGVAGEPEATTPKVILSEACGPHCIDGYCCGDRATPQINSPAPSTQLPVPTSDGPSAADVAGGVVVPDEAVGAGTAVLAEYETEPYGDLRLTAMRAAAKAVTAVRAVAERLEAKGREPGGDKQHLATAAGVRLALVKLVEIADELERGTDRG